MAISPFDVMKLIFSKEKYLTDDELKGYSQWMINKILSQDSAFVFLADELNKPMTNRMHYDTLYYGIPKSKKYIKWIISKKTTQEKDVKYFQEFYLLDIDTAERFVMLASDAEKERIRKYFENRGKLGK